MGFFDGLLGGSSTPTSLSKEESFCAILLSIVAADGDISDEEVNDFRAVVNRVQVLKYVNGSAFSQMIDKLFKILRKEGVDKLIDLGCSGLPQNLHKGTFVIACDFVYSDGDVDRDEIRLLEKIKDKLSIDDDFGRKVIEVMQAKAAL